MHLRLVMLCGGQQHLQGGPGESVLPSHALCFQGVFGRRAVVDVGVCTD